MNRTIRELTIIDDQPPAIISPVKWPTSVASETIVDRISFLKRILKEPDGEVLGQIFFTIKGERFTTFRGSDIAHCYGTGAYLYINTSHLTLGCKIMQSSVNNDLLIDVSFSIYTSPLVVSSEYLKSISVSYISQVRPRSTDITIFHAGFPDSAPVIMSLIDFARYAEPRAISCEDGVFSARTSATFTESDVEMFEKVLDHGGPMIALADVSPAVIHALEEFGIKFGTKNAIG